jgi:hypothetical protein
MRKLVICTAVIFVMAASAGAVTVNFTVDGWAGLPPTYQGDLWYGDTLEMITYTGTLNLTPGTQTLKINTFDWIIDATSYNAAYFYPTAARSMSIDGGPSGSLSQAGTLSCLPDNDYITFNNGAMATFTVQGYTVEVTPLGFSRAGGDHGEPFTGLPWYQAESDIMATFVVTPEPATICLLGLGVLGLLKKRRA